MDILYTMAAIVVAASLYSIAGSLSELVRFVDEETAPDDEQTKDD